ncbi:F-box/LRR-repeat protein 14-like [Venturia canescens]|uniref:F-box/LRR-repeat protein 14-like n=1 Tax=Venturia canescens TaxID=32260 RepID=UPI001C9C9B29|nr:F-box/LRR-repeat protein 14-like [Venturia canescens]
MEDSQLLMTELPGLTTGTTTTATRGGCTTLLQHRSGHYYHLHQPHLALTGSSDNGTLPLKNPTHAGCVGENGGTAGGGGVGGVVRRCSGLGDKDGDYPIEGSPGNGYNSLNSRDRYSNGGTTDLSSYDGQGISRLLNDLCKRSNSTSTHISSLYPEILALIFSHLDVRDKGRAAQVCVAWRDAAYHRSVWRGVEARLHLRKQAYALFASLVKRGVKRVQILSLRRGLGDVVKGIPNLESLNLSGCYNVTDSGLGNALSQDFPSLTELNLSLCKQVTDDSLSRIAQHLKNLEALELGGCCNISNTGLLLIAWGLKKLKRLDLRSCWHISDQGIAHVAGLNRETAEGNLALEHLGLQDCQRLSDEALRHVSVGLPVLKSINLSFCVSITDSGLRHLAKMPTLAELNLRSCDNISDVGMAYLAEGNSRISSLDVSFCDKIGDQALVHVSQGLFNLKSLSLSACQISDEGICKIAKTLHDLETLNIGQCSRITDKGFNTIAESMKHLKCIDLYGCSRMTPSGLESIMKLPQLSSLNLGLWHVR